MYRLNISTNLEKRLLASTVLAVAALVATSIPAGACTVSAGAKPQIALPLSAGVAALALAPRSASAEPNRPKKDSFVGLWDSKVISNGQVVDEGFDAFHSDGTEILVDDSAPATDNVCLGVWEKTGSSSIKLKHPSWYFDLNGNLLGVVIIYETLKLDPDGDSFHGTSSEDVYDTQGNKIGHYEAQIQANRITP
jgi:hypothetical protein